ncbi:MAG: hypothetical protein MR210_05315 [Erysipelotrichaceae bacterium]|nr:hypothetical protein [Erysipelotrichaceae bacterium]MDY5252226.1 hypothetical protein [Erysipelotrichaceae bacterium]
MTKVHFDNSFENYGRIIMITKNDEGEIHLAHSFYYGGRDEAKYLLFLYKDALPKNLDLLAGWNYLDDNSIKTVIIPEVNHRTSIEDFIAAFNIPSLNDIIFYEVDDFDQLNKVYEKLDLNVDRNVAYLFKK